jgi:hypothetical protein
VKLIQAIEALEDLKNEGNDPAIQWWGADHERWKASVVFVMKAALGENSETLVKFSSVSYSYFTLQEGAEEDRRARLFFAERVAEAMGLIEAAIYELRLRTANEIDPDNYDRDLWRHVQHSVEEERWDQVASAAATFVEDKVRRWAGNPPSESNGVLVGQALFAKVLAEGGTLALGSQIAETMGWRNLGMGFAAALSNVDRHRIQDRTDLKQYAIGVLGLASLILTQIRYTHPGAVS